MEKQKNTQMLIIGILSLALLAMSVGFASFTNTINITGNVAVNKANWNVFLDGNTYSETANPATPVAGTNYVSVDTTNRTITATSMVYNVTLGAPGDTYEFTIKVKNTGTFDAKLSSVNVSSVDSAYEKFLSYTVTYDGAEPSTKVGTTLAKSTGEATVKVTVKYEEPADAADLPQEDVTTTLSCVLTYDQA